MPHKRMKKSSAQYELSRIWITEQSVCDFENRGDYFNENLKDSEIRD